MENLIRTIKFILTRQANTRKIVPVSILKEKLSYEESSASTESVDFLLTKNVIVPDEDEETCGTETATVSCTIRRDRCESSIISDDCNDTYDNTYDPKSLRVVEVEMSRRKYYDSIIKR